MAAGRGRGVLGSRGGQTVCRRDMGTICLEAKFGSLAVHQWDQFITALQNDIFVIVISFKVYVSHS